jgi:hypothetical protein
VTPNQHRRQRHRSQTGRYEVVNPCNVCGKSAGVEYLSHPDTDGEIADELICLCKVCFDKLSTIPGKKAVELVKVRQATITDQENDS